MTGPDVIYKIVTTEQWDEANRAGAFKGAPVDVADGYIHFSKAEQVEETAAKHFSEQDGLLLVAVSAKALGDQLVYEPSRGGAMFPHLYGHLPMEAVLSVDALSLLADGRHQFPPTINPAGRSGAPTTR